MNSRISLYARVSSSKQTRNKTIESQVDILMDRIKKDGHDIIKDYTFVDDGYSGSTLVRPALEGLRDAVSNRLIEKIYIHSPDRLARNYAYQYLLIEEFKKSGVEIIFLNNSLEDNPESNLLLHVQGMISEYERTKIMERNRRGKIHAAKQGKICVLSGAPYGYRYINRHHHDGGSYIINIQEAKNIRTVFEWVGLEGVSLNGATNRLTELSIPTPTGKNIRWNRASLLRMLKNPAYSAARVRWA
jgi:site-specific DNA recombinase